MAEAAAAPVPRASIVDHLRVAWLLVLTLAGGLPFVLWFPLSPILRPWMMRRVRRRLQAYSSDALAAADAPFVEPELVQGRTVFVVAGEASGDRLAASVVRALYEAAPGITVRGYAGPACERAGARLDLDLTRHSAVGFFPIVASLGFWWMLCAQTLARFRHDPPDLLLTVDFPGLNVRLARWARKRGIRTVHVVAPQSWAHTPWRIFRWRAGVQRLLATFPFEPPLFEHSGIPTLFVGHPLFEAPRPAPRTTAEWPGEEPAIVELWPGSRRSELRRSVPVLLEAAAALEADLPEPRFVVRLSESSHEAIFEEHRPRARTSPKHVEFRTDAPGGDLPVLAALCTSGTATAQLAVDLVPLVAFYKIGFVDWCIMKLFITAPWICLVNLILGRRAVPERVTFSGKLAPWIASDLLECAGSPAAWGRTRSDLEIVRERLETPDVAARAGGWVLESLAKPQL